MINVNIKNVIHGEYGGQVYTFSNDVTKSRSKLEINFTASFTQKRGRTIRYQRLLNILLMSVREDLI